MAFSRGSIRWEDDEGPPVGRRPEIPRPLYASTPMEGEGLGGREETNYEVQDMRVEESGRGYVDMTNWQIQHLTELLESERRLVRVLSSASNIDLTKPGQDGLLDQQRGLPREAGTDGMPVLEDMRIKVLGDDGGLTDGGKDEEKKHAARDVYNHSCRFDDVMTPRLVGSDPKTSSELPQPVHKDLGWYEDLMKTKEPKAIKTEGGPEPARRKDERYLPRMKPSLYDGQTPYEDYQVQFHMLTELNGWSNDVKALYLAGCLNGSARSVLNDMDPQDRYNYGKLDEALRERFGTDDQSELFKAKLRNRVKNKEETLQELAHDIRRLVRLAYPKAPARTHDDLTKDQFIEALGDGEIRWSVFQARPKTITEALKVAMELEAFKESEKCRMRRNVRGIKTEGGDLQEDRGRLEGGDGGKEPTLVPLDLRQMAAQISQMHQMGRGYGGPETRMVGGKPVVGEKNGIRNAGPGSSPVGNGLEKVGMGSGERGYGMSRAPFDVSRIKCFRCDKMGHYARECPDLVKRDTGRPKDGGGLNA
jgi:hypothetical protein